MPKQIRRKKPDQHVSFPGLEAPTLLAPSWMLAAAILKKEGVLYPFWDAAYEDNRENSPGGGIRSLLAPYRWLVEYGAPADLGKSVTTLREAERVVEEEMARSNDGGIPRLFAIQSRSFLDQLSPPATIPSLPDKIAAASALRTAEKIGLQLSESQIENLRKVASIPPPLFEVLNGLSSIRQKIEVFKEISALAEKYLQNYNWRFDPARKVLKDIGKHSGRKFLTRCIVALYDEFGTDVPEVRKRNKDHLQEVRTRIKDHLQPVFDTELVDLPRGNIAFAIQNSPKKRIRKRSPKKPASP